MGVFKDVVGALLCLIILYFVWWLVDIFAGQVFCPEVVGAPISDDHGCRTDWVAGAMAVGAALLGFALMAIIYWALGDRSDN